MLNNKELAIKVNEIFHDLEGKSYQNKHQDIFKGETQRWKHNFQKIKSEYNSPITILDIGTGTGFVPINIAEFCTENDFIICSDLSQEMLKVAEKNLKTGFKCQFDFVKLSGNSILTKNADIITINSVVHHVPDLTQFFLDLNRITKPGGRIIIGHEPNKAFYNHSFLLKLFLFLQSFTSFKKFLITLARITKINRIVKQKNKLNSITEQINIQLIKEKAIENILSTDEINKMTDFHSPSAGKKIDKTKGIDISELKDKYLPNFEIEHLETYNFIGKISQKNLLFKKINKFLSRKYSGYGATFFVILKKL
jgi:ubiquinone/menaquinone biosynthesis C-methylase UbiE